MTTVFFLSLLLFNAIVASVFFKKIYARQKAELAKANLERLEQHQLFEDVKFKLAEANLNLLEQNEMIEEQKFKLAEANLNLMEMNEIIKKERKKSDKLLLNILPVKIAADLKEKGKTEPEKFENVTVLFSDLVSFTKMSALLEPKLLIDELNNIFTAFDYIIEKNHCERIKTIGDAYLCVCGMPEENKKHAENMIQSAIDMIAYLKERNGKSKITWRIRIGMHSGDVVGGVVGIKKYIYDVFGDTINTASRMESHSLPMKINVSETTYNLLKDKYAFTSRGLIDVKGKGKMKMYFFDTSDSSK